MRDELLAPEVEPDEIATEAGLRPRELAEFVGQAELKEHLAIILEAARRRGQAADHLLFAGPPGLGKTTLAGIVANEMGVALHVTSGPALERGGDLASILSQLAEGDVLFIDEIHRLARRSRKCCIRPWRTSNSTSSSARARRPVRSASTCRRSRWSVPRPAPASSPARSAIGSASSPASTTTNRPTWKPSCAQPPAS